MTRQDLDWGVGRRKPSETFFSSFNLVKIFIFFKSFYFKSWRQKSSQRGDIPSQTAPILAYCMVEKSDQLLRGLASPPPL